MPLLKQVKNIEKGLIGITEFGEKVLLSNPIPHAGCEGVHEVEERARRNREYYQIGGTFWLITRQVEITPYIIWKKKKWKTI